MILIVYAHPHKKGHCGHFLKETERQLKRAKQPYDLLDLYAEGFEASISETELLQQGTGRPPKGIAALQRRVLKADRLIFIYPVWWGSMPAILKGFFDRVFESKFAFIYDGGIPKGLLTGKRAAVFVTSGSNKLIMNTYLARRPLTLIARDILGFCGIKAKAFHYGGARRLDDTAKDAIAKTTASGMDWLGVASD